MRRLYHFCLKPTSRKLRILPEEKGLEFELQVENPWERRDALLALNHAGEGPLLLGGTPPGRTERSRLATSFVTPLIPWRAVAALR